MTDKKLRRLGRAELLELLLEQVDENEKLRRENEDLKARLEERIIKLETAGSIAEAALKLNRVFEAAEEAAKQYLESVKATVEQDVSQ